MKSSNTDTLSRGWEDFVTHGEGQDICTKGCKLKVCKISVNLVLFFCKICCISSFYIKHNGKKAVYKGLKYIFLCKFCSFSQNAHWGPLKLLVTGLLFVWPCSGSAAVLWQLIPSLQPHSHYTCCWPLLKPIKSLKCVNVSLYSHVKVQDGGGRSSPKLKMDVSVF